MKEIMDNKLTIEVAMQNFEALATMAPVKNPQERRILIESVDLIGHTLRSILQKLNEIQPDYPAHEEYKDNEER